MDKDIAFSIQQTLHVFVFYVFHILWKTSKSYFHAALWLSISSPKKVQVHYLSIHIRAW